MNSYYRKRTTVLKNLIKFVDKKLTNETTVKTLGADLGITEKQFNLMEAGEHRSNVLSKKVNQVIEVFTDAEMMNRYNMDRVLAGKTKAFGTGTVKEILFRVLDEAIVINQEDLM